MEKSFLGSINSTRLLLFQDSGDRLGKKKKQWGLKNTSLLPSPRSTAFLSCPVPGTSQWHIPREWFKLLTWSLPKWTDSYSSAWIPIGNLGSGRLTDDPQPPLSPHYHLIMILTLSGKEGVSSLTTMYQENKACKKGSVLNYKWTGKCPTFLTGWFPSVTWEAPFPDSPW
jgi:hypothetical protein